MQQLDRRVYIPIPTEKPYNRCGYCGSIWRKDGSLQPSSDFVNLTEDDWDVTECGCTGGNYIPQQVTIEMAIDAGEPTLVGSWI